ncbi:DUF58 domain-containing protein [Lignipirellula cremea]|uniref:DUF58 domain-containing protein n=1 Tax=Lignipirellula cremea TaxID=2528010 RepID=A0A518DX82_9BACT|nr:DUF58 domain-containing protein [Lignipirellula cremea]QDU96445.1 hypothetical protein Pla8534_42660 [Lignipirellula cremea]
MIGLWEIISPWLEGLRQRPWLLLFLFAAPYLLLTWRRKIYPSGLQILLLLGPCLATGLILARPELFPFLVAIDLAAAAAALVDLFTLPSPAAIEVERQLLRVASLQQNHRITLTVINTSRRVLRVTVRDDCPASFAYEPKQFELNLQPRSRSTVHYEACPSERGAFELERVYFRCRSWLGLWHQLVKKPALSIVHVYPDMKQLAEYAILARTNRLSQIGVRRTRKIGQDNEFERLRDYALDDNYKHIDWRTTARRRKLTVRDFQTSQSQRIIFLLDCGRMMTNESAGISLLDHSLNALLMMSYVALRQGDSVGLVSFSDKVHNFVPPRSGMSQMNRLLHASFDRFPQLVESRYDEAFLYLSAHCRKRSLVVLLTNVIDEVNSHQVQQYLGSAMGRHLPMGVLMRDHRLFDAADKEDPQGADFYRAAAAAEILTWRHQVLADLEHQGVLMIDTFAEDMTAKLVNRYLEVKARHLL